MKDKELEVVQGSVYNLSQLNNFEEMVKEYNATTNKDLTYDDSKPFDMNVYFYAEKCGQILTFYVKDKYNNCYGFGIVRLVFNIHIACIEGAVESIYVTPIARKLGKGKELLDVMFAKAKEFGCKCIELSAPYGSRLERVYMRKFEPKDTTFFHVL